MLEYQFSELKEFRTSMYKTLDAESDPFVDISRGNENSKLPFMKFLKQIDNTGDLLNDKDLIDHVKQRRSMRVELMTRKMDEARYLEFSKARAVSFANKNKHKFSDWVGSAGKLVSCKY